MATLEQELREMRIEEKVNTIANEVKEIKQLLQPKQPTQSTLRKLWQFLKDLWWGLF